jgi:uncharacterized protein YbdZ (MbtH family)
MGGSWQIGVMMRTNSRMKCLGWIAKQWRE